MIEPAEKRGEIIKHLEDAMDGQPAMRRGIMVKICLSICAYTRILPRCTP
jgi:hypothetical protein